jgi:curved DNA-binding protein CbpA
MSSAERRNLYRLLHVQPEAPVEVIKASYRALMSSLRVHPDLGGPTELAAQLNDAYAVLSDPQRRAAYDKGLRRPAPKAAPAAPAARSIDIDPQHWRQLRRCPLCSTAFAALAPKTPRCGHCGAPLTPAPSADCGDAELLGRRHSQRYSRVQDAMLHLPGVASPLNTRVKDLSLSGLALISSQAVEPGSALRVVANGFDAVARVVARRAHAQGFSVHAQLLTLQVLRAPTGTFVSTKA